MTKVEGEPIEKLRQREELERLRRERRAVAEELGVTDPDADLGQATKWSIMGFEDLQATVASQAEEIRKLKEERDEDSYQSGYDDGRAEVQSEVAPDLNELSLLRSTSLTAEEAATLLSLLVRTPNEYPAQIMAIEKLRALRSSHENTTE